MDGFKPYITGDGSVGLYSDEFNDIYHSGYGALSEAYEKFVFPVEIKKDNLNVLDVCFGLGYNSKAFLNYYGKNKKTNFDCLDINKNLFFLSPFIKTNHKLKDYFRKDKNDSKYVRLGKYKKYKIEDWVNQILIKNLYQEFGDDFLVKNFLGEKKFRPFFEPRIIKFDKFYQKRGYKTNKTQNKPTFLHNIYYQYLSKRYKYLFSNDIKFNFYIDDARKTVKTLNKQYDVIFLDAFTTSKCPQLWSLDFIKELYRLTAPEGVLLTYSNSIIVRNTMIESGYFTGKIINEDNKQIGTICSKSKSKIKYHLDDYETGLLKTRAGIPYRDENLSQTSSVIIHNRELEVENSNLISSSRYIKNKGVLK